MPSVKVRESDSFENALRKFKKQCEREGILSEIKKREHYEKPSVKRKRRLLPRVKKPLKGSGLRERGNPDSSGLPLK